MTFAERRRGLRLSGTNRLGARCGRRRPTANAKLISTGFHKTDDLTGCGQPRLIRDRRVGKTTRRLLVGPSVAVGLRAFKPGHQLQHDVCNWRQRRRSLAAARGDAYELARDIKQAADAAARRTLKQPAWFGDAAQFRDTPFKLGRFFAASGGRTSL